MTIIRPGLPSQLPTPAQAGAAQRAAEARAQFFQAMQSAKPPATVAASSVAAPVQNTAPARQVAAPLAPAAPDGAQAAQPIGYRRPGSLINILV